MEIIKDTDIIKDALETAGIKGDYTISPFSDSKRLCFEIDKKEYWLRIWERYNCYVRYSFFTGIYNDVEELISSKELSV